MDLIALKWVCDPNYIVIRNETWNISIQRNDYYLFSAIVDIFLFKQKHPSVEKWKKSKILENHCKGKNVTNTFYIVAKFGKILGKINWITISSINERLIMN